MIHVRNIRPEDWHVWRDLRLQALADSPDAFGETLNDAIQRSDSEWIASAATATKAERRLLLAEHEAQPVGMALIRVSPGDSTSADLFAMWVRPTTRRAGVGRALVDAATAWAKSQGVTQIILRVTEGNSPAERLYRSAGFVDTGAREPVRPGSPLQAHVMVRRTP